MTGKRWQALGAVISIGILITTFQNCGDVNIRQPGIPQELPSGNPSLQFCTSNSNRTFSFLQFWVVNLTARVKQNQLVADSDMDGRFDSLEIGNFTNGVRRSQSILDGVCLALSDNACDSGNTSEVPLHTAFWQRDIDRLSSSGPGRGYDADEDQVPDFLEILFGSDPTRQDLYENADFDGDTVFDFDELAMGRNPVSDFDNGAPANQILSYVREIDDSVPCANGNMGYRVQFQQLPILPTVEAFQSAEEPELNHEAGENVYMVFILSQSSDGQSPRLRQLQGQIFRASAANPQPPVLIPTDFELYGEWQAPN